jgi:hypothetical protein
MKQFSWPIPRRVAGLQSVGERAWVLASTAKEKEGFSFQIQKNTSLSGGHTAPQSTKAAMLAIFDRVAKKS